MVERMSWQRQAGGRGWNREKPNRSYESMGLALEKPPKRWLGPQGVSAAGMGFVSSFVEQRRSQPIPALADHAAIFGTNSVGSPCPRGVPPSSDSGVSRAFRHSWNV